MQGSGATEIAKTQSNGKCKATFCLARSEPDGLGLHAQICACHPVQGSC